MRWFWEFNISLAPDSNGLWANGNSCFENGPTTDAEKANEFVNAWRHIHDYFKAAGVTNVTWLWNPSLPSNGVGLTQFYPGSSYVDWLGIDGYDNQPNGPTFTDVMNVGNFYSTVSGPAYGSKPLMVGETGACNGAPPPYSFGQANYLKSAAGPISTNQFPLIKAFMFFDAPGQYCSANNLGWGDFTLLNPSPGLTEYDTMGQMSYFLPMVSRP